jgi:hypothetical protein
MATEGVPLNQAAGSHAEVLPGEPPNPASLSVAESGLDLLADEPEEAPVPTPDFLVYHRDNQPFLRMGFKGEGNGFQRLEDCQWLAADRPRITEGLALASEGRVLCSPIWATDVDLDPEEQAYFAVSANAPVRPTPNELTGVRATPLAQAWGLPGCVALLWSLDSMAHYLRRGAVTRGSVARAFCTLLEQVIAWGCEHTIPEGRHARVAELAGLSIGSGFVALDEARGADVKRRADAAQASLDAVKGEYEQLQRDVAVLDEACSLREGLRQAVEEGLIESAAFDGGQVVCKLTPLIFSADEEVMREDDEDEEVFEAGTYRLPDAVVRIRVSDGFPYFFRTDGRGHPHPHVQGAANGEGCMGSYPADLARLWNLNPCEHLRLVRQYLLTWNPEDAGSFPLVRISERMPDEPVEAGG